ncbi:methyltransferase family protein [Mucilaginibacter gracilis]|uniref:Methyltransferase family protein n=1 Tax=Mucilaginibacter gracilis TaxID=423350 RepID=A0A495IWW9_9SPHI|nr:class I SAM-dependent methyltransferase [Mucilaginibacter gracilis]RKR80851.1 methyltransferase family protein [Mucilaginibacter gracilis]
MNDLQNYFNNNTGRVINKWSQYFDVYDRHFSKYRGKDIVILEIGTFHGGSLQMWKDYFGPKAKIYGIDINPNCKEVEEENIKIMIGSQSDRDFLKKVKSEIPPIDILIDDGGHTMLQQIVTFEELFDHVKSDGIYLCEDLHTSYWMDWGGGYKRHGTFIEYSKNFIDYLHAYHSRQKSFQVNSFTKSVNSLHYYDSVLVIEKRPTPKPISSETGTTKIAFTRNDHPDFFRKIKYKCNRWLSYFRLPFRNGNFD